MIFRKEYMQRLCGVESDVEFLLMQVHELEKRIKKLEKPVKKEKKSAVKVSK